MNGLLSRMDLLIGIVLLSIFLLWSASKCKETKEQLQEEAQTEVVVDSLKDSSKKEKEINDVLAEALRKKREEQAAKAAALAKADSVKNAALLKQDSSAVVSTTKPAATSSTAPAASKLFITIDKLKIRSSPGLKSKVLGELPLFSEVYFMDEVTDSIYSLSLGKEMAHEPYIKVKTKRGTVGWVYGAGVNYYKKKREGVE